jgi:hypothetical protein
MKLTFDAFCARFKPRTAPGLDPDNDMLNGIIFDTHDAAHDLVLYSRRTGAELKNRIWTLIEDGGKQVIIEGRHRINRLGYIVTEICYDPAVSYAVGTE